MIQKAILKSFNAVSHTATIQLAGSLSVWLDAVPVSRAIPDAEMTAGRSLGLLLFDPGNPQDAVITAVWE